MDDEKWEVSTHRRKPPGRALNVTRFCKLDIWGSVPQPVNTESRKCDQVFLGLTRRKGYSQSCVSNLLHDDASP